MRAIRLVFSLVLLLTAGSVHAVPSEDGLYATFNTSKGSFVARLDFAKAPMTVANFVGLSRGSQAWVDFARGNLSREPFYDGLLFHNVVPGFFIQTGSRNGLGTDGPGYLFGDEFHPDLRHSAVGILSMANSGPNSNGSQFFVTLAPTPWLDDRYSVFGTIVEGLDVVQTIGAVPTPTEVTTIDNVVITAVGTAAEFFLASPPPGLPVVSDARPALRRGGSGLQMSLDRSPFTRYRFFLSPDLATWTFLDDWTDLAAAEGPFDFTTVAAGKSREFYRVVKTFHTPQPASLAGLLLQLTLTSGNQQIDIRFDAPEGYADDGNFGAFQINGGSPDILRGYFLDPSLETLYLAVSFGVGAYYTFALHFNDSGGGWFTGQIYGATDNYWPLFGSFVLSEPAAAD